MAPLNAIDHAADVGATLGAADRSAPVGLATAMDRAIEFGVDVADIEQWAAFCASYYLARCPRTILTVGAAIARRPDTL